MLAQQRKFHLQLLGGAREKKTCAVVKHTVKWLHYFSNICQCLFNICKAIKLFKSCTQTYFKGQTMYKSDLPCIFDDGSSHAKSPKQAYCLENQKISKFLELFQNIALFLLSQFSKYLCIVEFFSNQTFFVDFSALINIRRESRGSSRVSRFFESLEVLRESRDFSRFFKIHGPIFLLVCEFSSPIFDKFNTSHFTIFVRTSIFMNN